MNGKVLIVDDEQNIRTTLKHCLKSEGYDLDIAVNGEEALDKIKGGDFDLVLLDIKMPGLSGMEVLSRLREEGNEVNIIIMTAYGTVEKAVEAMKLGAIDFLSKPFTPDEIRSIVNKVLSRQDLKEEKLDNFDDIIEYSKRCIIEKKYDKAEKFLRKSISMEIASPEPYNLLGVLAESRGDNDGAAKHYRAALDFDPTYVPAQRNLERITQFRYTTEGMDLGDEDDKQENER